MALATTATLKGDTTVYQLSPEVKRYTLRDVGFTEKKNGSYLLEQPLDISVLPQKSIKLKMTVNKDLQHFRMGVVSANGLQPVDIFNQPAMADKLEQFQFVIQNLLERKVLTN